MTSERLEKIRKVVEGLESHYKVQRDDQDVDDLALYFCSGAIKLEVVRELLDEIGDLKDAIKAQSGDIDYLLKLKSDKR